MPTLYKASEAQEQLMQGSVHPVAIDMNGRYELPSQSNTTTYRPSDADIEQPPPSYQDYSKDHRVPA
jgi:hypothetical protein